MRLQTSTVVGSPASPSRMYQRWISSVVLQAGSARRVPASLRGPARVELARRVSEHSSDRADRRPVPLLVGSVPSAARARATAPGAPSTSRFVLARKKRAVYTPRVETATCERAIPVLAAARRNLPRVLPCQRRSHGKRAWARPRKATKQMNMTSRYSLLAGVAGLIWAGCSAPAEEVEDAPTLPPPGYTNQAGTTGNPPVASAGAACSRGGRDGS